MSLVMREATRMSMTDNQHQDGSNNRMTRFWVSAGNKKELRKGPLKKIKNLPPKQLKNCPLTGQKNDP